MRSRCKRSIITTSTSFKPSCISSKISQPKVSMPEGISVGGAINRMRFSIFPNRIMFERATRECAISPQIAMLSRCKRPFARWIVKASSSAWVGCSWRPSPAFNTLQFTFWASKSTAPECGWRTTKRSGCIAFNVIAVSIRVSPFLIELACMDMFITSAPNLFPASSKEACVRVEFSKNIFTCVRPANTSECLFGRLLRST